MDQTILILNISFRINVLAEMNQKNKAVYEDTLLDFE